MKAAYYQWLPGVTFPYGFGHTWWWCRGHGHNEPTPLSSSSRVILNFNYYSFKQLKMYHISIFYTSPMTYLYCTKPWTSFLGYRKLALSLPLFASMPSILLIMSLRRQHSSLQPWLQSMGILCSPIHARDFQTARKEKSRDLHPINPYRG